MIDLRQIKKDLRNRMRDIRHQACVDDPSAPDKMRDLFIDFIAVSEQAVIASYAPLPDEMDTRPLMTALQNKGINLCLPVVIGPKSKLIFRAFHVDDTLAPGCLNVEEPLDDQEEMVPTYLLLPLLAFDRQGHRLGYGGGYYDRTLSSLRRSGTIRAIGIAYAVQEVASVPIGRYDHPLDMIVTEREIIIPVSEI